LLHITAKGEQEFRILTYAANEAKLLVAEIELIPLRPPTPMDEKVEALALKLELILQYLEPDIRFEKQGLDDPDWICHRLLELLPLTPEAKYELLQLPSNIERLESLSALQIEIAEQ